MILLHSISYWVEGIIYTFVLLGSLFVAFLVLRLLFRLNYPKKEPKANFRQERFRKKS